MYRILIIEDDITLSNGITLALKDSQYEFIQCFNLTSAKIKFQSESPDLVILDINLPDGNGLDFLKYIRQAYTVPVILLTANDMEIDIVTGLEYGADDYITKPFSLMVLRARVNTQIRHLNARSQGKIQIDQFIFDFNGMEYRKDGILVELSKTEQKLLRMLVENKGKTLTRAELVDRIWTDGAEYVDENALSVTVKRLRDKLEDNPAEPKYLKTVYGIGYVWVVT